MEGPPHEPCPSKGGVRGAGIDPSWHRRPLTGLQYINGPLALEHSLDDNETEKPLLDVEGFWEILQCHWVTDTNTFPNKRQRVQLATILLLAAYTTSRPAALLGVTYGDVKLFVQRDGKTEASALMLQVQLRKMKSAKKRKRPYVALDTENALLADGRAERPIRSASMTTPSSVSSLTSSRWLTTTARSRGFRTAPT